MPQYSIRQVVHVKKKSPGHIRVAALVLSVIALLVLAVVILSISTARTMMRVPPKPLANYSSAMMPSFSLASIRSLDDQNRLTGWMFQPQGTPLGTVVMVHDNGANRLQFDADTLMLYDFFTSRGYGVLSFDLRHAGESDGEFATYGYNEWEDVLVAMEYAWQNSTTDNLILYGFGSGCAATLLAMDNLPAESEDHEAFYGNDTSVKSERLRKLPISRRNVVALILDGYAASLDAYIQADLSDGFLDRIIQRHTVPAAVRFSAQSSTSARLIPILSRIIMPVFLIGEGPGGETYAGSTVMADERVRLHPDSTLSYDPEDAGFLESFPAEPEIYIDELEKFMIRFPDRHNG